MEVSVEKEILVKVSCEGRIVNFLNETKPRFEISLNCKVLKTVSTMILNFKRILKLTLNLQHKMETRKACR